MKEQALREEYGVMFYATHAETMVSSFGKEYMEKIFYFCLKRTGSVGEAEDLTSDIAVSVISALRQGKIPAAFPAWVWRIARNRYSLWAKTKHKRSCEVCGDDIAKLDPPGEASVEADYLRSEELGLLRRELAFMAKDYREILLAFYIEDRKIGDIADSLHIAEGTVKAKLFRCRNMLKEGMNMAREFGVRSYKPEEVSFSSSGNQPSGLPWSAVDRQIPKNILLQAHNNPSTAEELSIELGIALPYMEEEIRILKDATLLKQNGKKYETNFFIADRECQMDVYQACRRDAKERGALLDKIVTDCLDDILALSIYRNGMPREGVKWLPFLLAADYLSRQVRGYDIRCTVQRNDGGDWGFMGFEQTDMEEKLWIWVTTGLEMAL